MSQLKFTGDENITRILDQLWSQQASIYGQTITVSTKSGTFRGTIISKGGQFLMLEQDTRVNAMTKETTQRIFSQQLIAVDSITAIYFEVLRDAQ